MTGWIAAGVMLAAAVAVVLLARWRSARLIRRLDAMLTAAMEGDFSETSFDESRLSALESRMARYLAASTLSARNLQTQKDQISALISDISHQTRTPVANLQLYAQLLEEQPLTPQGQRCAQAIAAQSEKLQTLMEALVKSSRLETGLLTLHPEPGQLAPMVERAAAQYAPKAQAKQIRLTVGRTDGGALFDPKWTEEALCNLLDNAVKYTPDGGEVTVEVRPYEWFTASGRRAGDWPLSHPADCRRSGGLCPGEKCPRSGQHLLAVSAPGVKSVQTVTFRKGPGKIHVIKSVVSQRHTDFFHGRFARCAFYRPKT